ncbi:hypothetical protein BDV19DRAFT_193875 [Aspergillus venezuelensis]
MTGLSLMFQTKTVKSTYSIFKTRTLPCCHIPTSIAQFSILKLRHSGPSVVDPSIPTMTSSTLTQPPADLNPDPTADSTPCTACTWTPHRQHGCAYKSHIQIFYECSDRAVWSLGSHLVLKDRGPSHPTNEVPNVRFVKENTSINVPDIIETWEENGGHK